MTTTKKSNSIAFCVPYVSCALSGKAWAHLQGHPLGSPDLAEAVFASLKAHRLALASSSLLLTSSCTQAMALSALALGLTPEDEVILPSFTYAATANAFASTGAQLLFADVDPLDMNLCPTSVARLMSDRTKVVVPIHYGGRSADMAALTTLCRQHPRVCLVEDAAHAIGSSFQGIPLGSIGHFGAVSFHHTKNITAGGNGGLLLLNPDLWQERSDQKDVQKHLQEIYTQGTNRQAFLAGENPCYTWQRLGGAFEPSPYVAAYLLAALPDLETVTQIRLDLVRRYREGLRHLAEAEKLRLPVVREGAQENAHNFYLLLGDAAKRSHLSTFLHEKQIDARTHYQPLHLSKGGQRYGKTPVPLTQTQTLAPCLLRLPLHHALLPQDVDRIVHAICTWAKRM